MTTPSRRPRAATLAVLLALFPAAPAHAKGHATAHANAAVHAQNAAKQEVAAWQHQEQALMHQQQAMIQQQMKFQRANQAQAHRYPSRHQAHRTNGYRNYAHYNNSTNRPTNAQIGAALHSVIAELNRADHDYQGHRAQAVHHLGLAIRSLQPQGANANLAMNTGPNTNRVTLTGAAAGRPGSNGVAGAPGVAGASAHRMPQAQSDAHLNKARHGLMTFQAQMNHTNSNQHHQALHNHVQRAMQELNLALNIR